MRHNIIITTAIILLTTSCFDDSGDGDSKETDTRDPAQTDTESGGDGDGDGDSDTGTPGDGDGDGDGSGDGDGDGDGETETGADTSGDGDGDGDGDVCPEGTEDCPCGPDNSCEGNLGCIEGICIACNENAYSECVNTAEAAGAECLNNSCQDPGFNDCEEDSCLANCHANKSQGVLDCGDLYPVCVDIEPDDMITCELGCYTSNGTCFAEIADACTAGQILTCEAELQVCLESC